MKPYIRIDIIREGRDPTNEFSTGTIIRATCAKEYRLVSLFFVFSNRIYRVYKRYNKQ